MRAVVVCGSNYGHTKVVAEAIAVGAQQVEGNDVRLQGPEETTAEDLQEADAIIWGSAGYFGLPTHQLKAMIDKLGGSWFGGKLINKVGGTFCTTSTTHGGIEECNRALQTPMFHLGMIVVGAAEPISPDSVRYGVPYGVGVVVPVEAGKDAPMNKPNEQELERARRFGKRVAEIAGRLAAVPEPALH